MIGEMILGLSCGTALRYEPDLVAWQVNAVGSFRAIGSAYAQRAEVSDAITALTAPAGQTQPLGGS